MERQHRPVRSGALTLLFVVCGFGLVALRLRHFVVTDNAFQALTILFPANLYIAIGSRVSG